MSDGSGYATGGGVYAPPGARWDANAAPLSKIPFALQDPYCMRCKTIGHWDDQCSKEIR